MDLLKLTALELGKKIKAGEVTVREAVRAVIEQAKEVEPAINSYVTLDEEGAYAQAVPKSFQVFSRLIQHRRLKT